jgi:hypothetical protein
MDKLQREAESTSQYREHLQEALLENSELKSKIQLMELDIRKMQAEFVEAAKLTSRNVARHLISSKN